MEKEEMFMRSGDVIKVVNRGLYFYCVKGVEDQALIATAYLNNEQEWSFYMREAITVSNKKSHYDLSAFEFVNK